MLKQVCHWGWILLFQRTPDVPSHLSSPFLWRCKLSAPAAAPSLPACRHDPWHDGHGLTFWNCKTQTFLSLVALAKEPYHSKRKLTFGCLSLNAGYQNLGTDFKMGLQKYKIYSLFEVISLSLYLLIILQICLRFWDNRVKSCRWFIKASNLINKCIIIEFNL